MNKIKCRYCKSENTVKRGLTHNKKQRHLCKDCKKTFIEDNGFYKMKNSPELITMAIDMYISNLSSRKMRNQIKRHSLGNVSHQTILSWVRKYIIRVNDFITTLEPKLSGKIYADETEIKRGKKNDIFWCSVDWETRYINATLYSNKNQNMKDAVSFMNKIRKSGKVDYVQTDALMMYPTAFKKAFKYHPRRNNKVEHKVNNVSKTKKHNVRIETVFSKIKDRVEDFRSLKALWSAPIMMLGLVIQHNFIERHCSINTYPCELAGINLDLGVNRWLGLIKLSCCS